MSRYSNIEVVKKQDTRKYVNTIIYPIITPKSDDIYIITREGDRLDNLSWEYYQNPTYWWIIARANNIGKGTMFPETGTQLRIPSSIENIISEYNELNDVE